MTAMSWLASVLLRVLHIMYGVTIIFWSSFKYFRPETPQPLNTQRRRIPSHLAIVLVSYKITEDDDFEEVLMESVEKAVTWCREVGIVRLTAYDKEGVLLRCSQGIRSRVTVQPESMSVEDSDSDLVYPLTPPLSDSSESRPISPKYEDTGVDLGGVTINASESSAAGEQSRRQRSVLTRRRTPRSDLEAHARPLKLHLISQKAAKSAIVSTTRLLAHECSNAKDVFNLSVQDLDSYLDGQHGVLPPDLLIVHTMSPPTYDRRPLELHGFPPWQIRVTEIHHTKPDWCRPRQSVSGLCALEEIAFREALDEFAGAEMRLGR